MDTKKLYQRRIVMFAMFFVAGLLFPIFTNSYIAKAHEDGTPHCDSDVDHPEYSVCQKWESGTCTVKWKENNCAAASYSGGATCTGDMQCGYCADFLTTQDTLWCCNGGMLSTSCEEECNDSNFYYTNTCGGENNCCGDPEETGKTCESNAPSNGFSCQDIDICDLGSWSQSSTCGQCCGTLGLLCSSSVGHYNPPYSCVGSCEADTTWNIYNPFASIQCEACCTAQGMGCITEGNERKCSYDAANCSVDRYFEDTTCRGCCVTAGDDECVLAIPNETLQDPYDGYTEKTGDWYSCEISDDPNACDYAYDVSEVINNPDTRCGADGCAADKYCGVPLGGQVGEEGVCTEHYKCSDAVCTPARQPSELSSDPLSVCGQDGCGPDEWCQKVDATDEGLCTYSSTCSRATCTPAYTVDALYADPTAVCGLSGCGPFEYCSDYGDGSGQGACTPSFACGYDPYDGTRSKSPFDVQAILGLFREDLDPGLMAVLIRIVYRIVAPLIVVIGMILVVLSGYRLMTATDDVRKVMNSRDQLSSALMGLVVAIFGMGILRIIINTFINNGPTGF